MAVAATVAAAAWATSNSVPSPPDAPHAVPPTRVVPRVVLPPAEIDARTRIAHALNRLGYGPRPGDVERVRDQGLARWIGEQLWPGADDHPEVDRRLARLETLAMSSTELWVAYPPAPLLRGVERLLARTRLASGATVRRLLPELEHLGGRTRESPRGSSGRPAEDATPPSRSGRTAFDGPARIGIELAQAKLIRATYSDWQLREVLVDFWFNHFNVHAAKGTVRWTVAPYERDAIRPHVLGRFRDLLGATARHPAMLFYLDNWLSADPSADVDPRIDRRYASRAVREAGLPPGGVATLLLRDRGFDTEPLERLVVRHERRTTSTHARVRPGAEPRGPRREGLNENYARELLELHTLGVDGGYTEHDVREVARAFSGWTLLPIHAGGDFAFVPELHEPGVKTVLGRRIPSGGRDEGEAVLDLLAAHPATARFVSAKLARRFVGDEPPPSLVDRMADTFLATGGDLREVMVTLVGSPEFWAPETMRAKVKTPLEFVVGLLRATGADLQALPDRLDHASRATTMQPATAPSGARPGALGALRELGQPPFGAVPPTGYADTAEAWVSSGAMLARFRIALAVAANRLPGAEVPRIDAPEAGRSTSGWLQSLGRRMTGLELSHETTAALGEQIDMPARKLEELGIPAALTRHADPRPVLAAAWIAVSPEFQRK